MIPFMLIMMIMITKDKFGGTSCFLRRTPAKAELRVCEKCDSCLGEYNDDDDDDCGCEINGDDCAERGSCGDNCEEEGSFGDACEEKGSCGDACDQPQHWQIEDRYREQSTPGKYNI